jgi:hypothetical protein
MFHRIELKKIFKTLYLQTRSAVYDNDFNEKKKNNKKINYFKRRKSVGVVFIFFFILDTNHSIKKNVCYLHFLLLNFHYFRFKCAIYGIYIMKTVIHKYNIINTVNESENKSRNEIMIIDCLK